MRREKIATNQLCLAGLFLALGIILPQCFHLLGGPVSGRVFLPMHIPVFLTGMLLGNRFGFAVGFVTPTVSFLLTGMPSFARLPFMLVELAAYGWFSGVLAPKLPAYATLAAAQIAGRLAYGMALFCGVHLLGIDISPAVTLTAALAAGLPGIAVQLLLIPPVVMIVRKRMMKIENMDHGRLAVDGAGKSGSRSREKR